MTRLERATAGAEKAAEELRKRRQRLAEERDKQRARERQAELKKQTEARQATNKRRYHVGALADESGLLVWDNDTIAAVLALLTPLTALPDPVGTLDALIGVPLVLAGHGVTVLSEGDTAVG